MAIYVNNCHWCPFKARMSRDMKRHEAFFHYAQWAVRESSRKQTVTAFYHMQRRGKFHGAAGLTRKPLGIVGMVLLGFALLSGPVFANDVYDEDEARAMMQLEIVQQRQREENEKVMHQVLENIQKRSENAMGLEYEPYKPNAPRKLKTEYKYLDQRNDR